MTSGRLRPAFMGFGWGWSVRRRVRGTSLRRSMGLGEACAKRWPNQSVRASAGTLGSGAGEARAGPVEAERVRNEQAEPSARGAQERQGCAGWRSQPEGPKPGAARPAGEERAGGGAQSQEELLVRGALPEHHDFFMSFTARTNRALMISDLECFVFRSSVNRASSASTGSSISMAFGG